MPGRSPRPPNTAAAYLKPSYPNCRAKTVGAPVSVCGSSDRNLPFCVNLNGMVERKQNGFLHTAQLFGT
jgi:hypothetical protein